MDRSDGHRMCSCDHRILNLTRTLLEDEIATRGNWMIATVSSIARVFLSLLSLSLSLSETEDARRYPKVLVGHSLTASHFRRIKAKERRDP